MARCATFDVSADCPLRCAHCYFYAQPAPPASLPAEAYLQRLVRLRDGHRLTTALWVGGEPLTRPELLVRAARLFSRNAVATSGLLPVPDELDAGLLVSIDGLEPEHDRLRGRGAWRRTLRALERLRPRPFALQLTLTALTLSAIDSLPQLVAETGAAGVLVGFYTGAASSPLAPSAATRARAVERLLGVKARAPGVVLNSEASLDLLGRRSGIHATCPYRNGELAFDALLKRKRPCTYGAAADCESCGCALLALRGATDSGDVGSREVLLALFPPRART